nr:MAG TPA: hypothetical protein [Caudoviricetes sp.]
MCRLRRPRKLIELPMNKRFRANSLICINQNDVLQ